MISIFWNCRGLGHAVIVRTLQELCNSHRPTLLFLYETKISLLPCLQAIALSLSFDHLHAVPSRGSSGGLVLFWKNTLDLKVIVSYDNFISVLILNDPLHESWMLTGVYGPIPLAQKLDF